MKIGMKNDINFHDVITLYSQARVILSQTITQTSVGIRTNKILVLTFLFIKPLKETVKRVTPYSAGAAANVRFPLHGLA